MMATTKRAAKSYGRGALLSQDKTKLLRQVCKAASSQAQRVLFNGQIWKVVDKGAQYYTLRPLTTNALIAVKITECQYMVTQEVPVEKLTVSDDGQALQFASIATKHEKDQFIAPLASVHNSEYRFILDARKGIGIQKCVPANDAPITGRL